MCLCFILLSSFVRNGLSFIPLFSVFYEFISELNCLFLISVFQFNINYSLDSYLIGHV